MTPQGESPRTKRARLDAEKEVSGPQVNEVNGAVTSVGSDALPRTDLHALPPSSDQPLWQQVIADAVKSIVSVRFSQVASFDTEVADTSEATGFVVDAERGIILTNRHVTCAGPFVGEAVFHDHEETDVFPLYRDPIHDFGFLRFDPKAIKYMDLKAIDLAPEAAQVGLDIRVVGNDAGEKLSILAGSISRLDRNAPHYGELTYNDFNTFYLQAASSTSGGSSGSPVLNNQGRAVALQAGGHTQAATDFFFPLDRVKRALGYIQRGESVPRGTIQTQFLHKPFDEVRRLGLREETEAHVRQSLPKEIGMLVAETVVPEGPGAECLQEGDVLVKINGTLVTHFVSLEDLFDTHIGSIFHVDIERGGSPMSFDITVQDLHSITPDRYLSAGGSKFNDLSYQLARQFAVPVAGVYVAEMGGMFKVENDESGWIVSSLNAIPTPNLDAFIEAFRTLSDGDQVPMTYYSIGDVHTKNMSVISVDRHWSAFRIATRNDISGFWDFTTVDNKPPKKVNSPVTVSFPDLDPSLGNVKNVFQSLVKVKMSIPFRIEGYPKSRKQGAGLVLDAQRGLVVCSRMIVPVSLGDVTLTVADSVTIPARILFLHPTHNFAILSYDPSLLGATPLLSAQLSPTRLAQGHKVTLVAYNHNQRPVSIQTTVTDDSVCNIPPNATPRFRAINFDALTLDTPLAQSCSSGALADSQGQIQGLWLNFMGDRSANGTDREYHLGIRLEPVRLVLEKLQMGQTPLLRGLAVEVAPSSVSHSRQLGASDEWIKKVEKANPARRQLYMVRHNECGSETSKALKDLDLILALNGRPASSVSDFDLGLDWKDSVDVTLVRDKVEMELSVPTSVLDGECTKKIMFWAGAMLHEPHRAVRQQSQTIPSSIYVSARAKGSPAYMYGLVATQYILSVNGHPTETLDAFLAATQGLKDGEYVRIKTVSFDGIPAVVSVKCCHHYWPTSVLLKSPEEERGWKIVEGNEDLLQSEIVSDGV